MTVDRRNEVIRVVGAGLGAPLGLAIAGWPHAVLVSVAVGLIGAVIGVLLAFGAEHLFDGQAELHRLRNRVSEVEAEIENVHKLNNLLEHQTRVAQAEAGINAIWMEVYGGALQEAARTGSVLPVEALLARVQVMQKAKGLDKPIPPPSV
jgi:cell division protein FtsB